MSYDISFKVKVEGVDRHVEVGECGANTTWNVREMIKKATGLEWKNCENNGLCKDVMPQIEKGWFELWTHPEQYKKYESPNGWGTVEGTLHFFHDIIVAWEDLKKEMPDVAEVATFWIH